MKLHLGNALLKRIERHLRSRKTEQVAFLFLECAAEDALVAADIYLVPASELVFESRFHAEVSEAAQAKIIKAASDRKLLLGEIHSHPGCARGAEFSPSDLSGFEDFVPHIFWRLRVKQYVALVFGDHDFDGLAWVNNANDPLPLDSLVVDGRELLPTGATARELDRRKKEAERYSRQTAMFGKEGQRRLAQTSVAIAGIGGLGCHIVQQLAYAGVKRYVLIDPDRVDRSNLNRFVIGTERDLGRLKVEVAAEFIRRVQPDADVTVVAGSLVSRSAFEGIATADFVFGCLDNDGPRLVLLELCCSARRPYIDVATDVPGAGAFGGRLVFTGIGKGCLSCREELDQKEVWRFFASPEQRAEDDKIYGIDRAALGAVGPSVVFLNGVVASLAVTEFAAFITGLRTPVGQLNYRGEMGIVTTPKLLTPGCYYCDEVWNGRVKPNPDRYIVPSPSLATTP
jgi:molybdopterin-synthase adenylyltransferase